MMKTYQNHAMTDAEARQALADACKQVETNLPLYTYQCQNHSSVGNIYPGCANNQWTCGFWPGEIWLAYEATEDEKFKAAALIQVDSFADRIARKVEVDHHDMGFLYSPTCVAAWKLVGSEKGKNAAIAAADQLLTRYQPSGRFLQAWGTILGSAGDRQRPLPVDRRRPHRHHAGKLLPAGRQHLPHLLYEPGRHPQGRPHLSGL